METPSQVTENFLRSNGLALYDGSSQQVIDISGAAAALLAVNFVKLLILPPVFL